MFEDTIGAMSMCKSKKNIHYNSQTKKRWGGKKRFKVPKR